MSRHVVLLGIGHTNAHVLRMWRSHAPASARLSCVSDYPVATYSGMLPGVLAGLYPRAAMQIDLERLAQAAGAQLVVGEVTGLDLGRQQVLLAGRPAVGFDVLSIGIGSVPTFEGVDVGSVAQIVEVKPMQTFLDRLERQLREAAAARGHLPLRVAIVGGGAGGIEVAFCLPARLRALFGDAAAFELTVVTASEQLQPGSLPATARRVARVLARRGVRMLTGTRVTRVDGQALTLDRGMRVEADAILWATGAAAPPLLGRLGLPTAQDGFLLTGDTLQSTSGAPVFAVGDTGTIEGTRLPKAGVYAVREAPVLWENVQRILAGRPLRRYVPQGGFLKLLNTGDGRAIGEWKGLSFEGAWCWRLKDYIDRRFMSQFNSGSG